MNLIGGSTIIDVTQARSEDPMDDRRLVREVYAAMWRAQVSQDTDALAELLDEGFTLTHMSGRVQDKPTFLREVETGGLRYFSEREHAVDVRVSGSHAHCTGDSFVEASVWGGGRVTWPLRQDLELERRGDRWVILSSVASAFSVEA